MVYWLGEGMRGMKDFSLHQMRKEYEGVLRCIAGSMVVWLLAGAMMGAVAIVGKGGNSQALLFGASVFLVPPLVCLGLYLIFSDSAWLLKKTPYGRALRGLGDAQRVMEEIDKSALRRYDDRGGFILLDDWLILRYPDGWRMDPRRVSARPIRRRDIQGAKILPGQNGADPQEMIVRLAAAEDAYEFRCWQRQDWDALRTWLEEGERSGQ